MQISIGKIYLLIGAVSLLGHLPPVDAQVPGSSTSQPSVVAPASPTTAAHGKAQLPFKIGNAVSRTAQKLTGITFVSEFVASQAAKAAIHKQVDGKVRVAVKTWSLTDLLAGKVKSVKVTIKNCTYKGTPVGDLNLSSQTPIWLRYLKAKEKRAGLRNPILLSFTSDVEQKNVARALEGKQLERQLRGLKLDLPGLGEQQLEVLNPKVNMTEEQIAINGTLVTSGASPDTGVPITIAGRVELLGNDRIILKNMVVDSPEIMEPQKFAEFVEQLLNPLVNLQRFDKANMALRLNSLKMSQGRLNAAGNLILAPHFEAAAKAISEGNGTVSATKQAQ
jgi:hypothetical protein